MNMHLFFWAPFLAASAHIFEEFVFPGGFAPWYRRCRPKDPTITTRRLVIANGILIFFCLSAGLFGPNRYGVQIWLIVMGSLFANSIFHINATIRMREYSPGVATACFVYVPVTALGVWWLIRIGMVRGGHASLFLLSGAAIMLYIDLRHFIAGMFRPASANGRSSGPPAFGG